MGARTHYFKSARRAPIILGVLDEHQFSRRARAITTQRGTSTHCSKANKQKAIAKWTWKKWVHEMLSWKNGCARTHYFGGSTSTDYFRRARRAPILKGREHSSFREHSIRELMNKHIWIWKESQKNKLMKYSLEKWGRAPIILGACALIILGARRAPIFKRARRAPIFKRARALIISRGHSCTKLMWHF